jgi:hypothetical protein
MMKIARKLSATGMKDRLLTNSGKDLDLSTTATSQFLWVFGRITVRTDLGTSLVNMVNSVVPFTRTTEFNQSSRRHR